MRSSPRPRAPRRSRARSSRLQRPSQIAGAVAGAGDGPELVALAGALGPAPAAEQWLRQLRHVRLEIDGRELVDAGVPQGPAVGRGLRAALAAKLDGLASDRDAELEVAVTAARDPSRSDWRAQPGRKM